MWSERRSLDGTEGAAGLQPVRSEEMTTSDEMLRVEVTLRGNVGSFAGDYARDKVSSALDVAHATRAPHPRRPRLEARPGPGTTRRWPRWPSTSTGPGCAPRRRPPRCARRSTSWSTGSAVGWCSSRSGSAPCTAGPARRSSTSGATETCPVAPALLPPAEEEPREVVRSKSLPAVPDDLRRGGVRDGPARPRLLPLPRRRVRPAGAGTSPARRRVRRPGAPLPPGPTRP